MTLKKSLYSLIILCCLFLNNCGYTPVYSSKGLSLSFNKIEHDSTKINNKIVRILKSLSKENSQNKIDLKLNTKKENKILSKNKKGDPDIFEIIITLEIEIDEIKQSLSESQRYSNKENKFELSNYEKTIEDQIIEKLISNLINYLSNF